MPLEKPTFSVTNPAAPEAALFVTSSKERKKRERKKKAERKKKTRPKSSKMEQNGAAAVGFAVDVGKKGERKTK